MRRWASTPMTPQSRHRLKGGAVDATRKQRAIQDAERAPGRKSETKSKRTDHP